MPSNTKSTKSYSEYTAEGHVRVAVWLPPAVAPKLAELEAAHGSRRAAIEAAVIAAPVPEAPLRTVTVYVPALRRGAPSNRSGIRPSVYQTRAAARQHEHWSNQAPYGTTRAVAVCDQATGSAEWMNGEQAGIAHTVCYEPSPEEQAHLEARRWASAILTRWGKI